MKLLEAANRFYYDMTLNELSMMNQKMLYPNITYNSLLYLDLIVYKENCTVSYLAEALHVAKSAVTMKVNELVRQGLVEKVASETDRRVHYLKVRPAIAAEYQTFDRQTQHALAQVERQFTKEEIGLLCKMLEALSTAYREGGTDE